MGNLSDAFGIPPDPKVDSLRVIHPTPGTLARLAVAADQSSEISIFGIDWATICPLCEIRAPTLRAICW